MRILHILGDLALPRNPDNEPASGAVRSALELASAQVKLGHKVWVASASSTRWRETWDGVTLMGVRPARWARLRVRQHIFDFRAHVPFVLLTRQHTFDVVHGHMYAYMRFLRAHTRVVHIHTDPLDETSTPKMSKRDFCLILRETDAQIAVSNFVAERFYTGTGGRGNVQVVYNGVNLTRFDYKRAEGDALRMRQRFHLSESDLVFLYVGAIVQIKGVLPLIHAFNRLATKLPHVHLFLAGSSSLWNQTLNTNEAHHRYEQQVKATVEASPVRNRIHLLGSLDILTIPIVYAASDVMVVPSLWQEPFALVILEAMAMGRPVIASNVGGIPEVIDPDDGILVPPGDERALEAAMKEIGQNTRHLEYMRTESRQRVRHFTWERAARELDKVYLSEKRR